MPYRCPKRYQALPNHDTPIPPIDFLSFPVLRIFPADPLYQAQGPVMRKLLMPFLILICLGRSLSVSAQGRTISGGAIRVNQIGFYPAQPKIAVALNKTSGSFWIINQKTGDTAWKGKLAMVGKDPYSGQKTTVADFSGLTLPGTYFLSTQDLPRSYPFVISPDAWQPLGKGVLKAYYFLRCSEQLLPRYAGKWSREEGHPDTAVYIHASAASPGRPAGSLISAPGGWYDAGDYNKYIVNSGITMSTLLAAYEDFPAYFDTLQTQIPESGNGIPDLLNEVLWNLRWMLSMQDPKDGGVYHKLTTAKFDGMEMPDADHAPRYVIMKTTAATLDFAAVMAQAARVFRHFSGKLPGLADSCLRAASTAWTWVSQHPDIRYDQSAMNERYQPQITTGAYGDQDLQDERFWAACEMWVTTRERKYEQALQAHFPKSLSVPSWNQVNMLGCYTLLRRGEKDDSVHRRFLQFAAGLLKHHHPAYHTVMGSTGHDFIWGSNAVAANEGVILIKAYLLSGDKRYLTAAAGNLDYLLGRNATGYCFVTGFGSHSPLHPHHRPSISDGIAAPIPGLLVGGPNPGQQDHQTTYPNRIPDESYTDNDQAYAANEIAINWNAPLVYLANALAALLDKK